MHQIAKLTLKLTLALMTFLAVALAPQPGAAQAEKRMALVIGNGAYQTGALATPANDAGLIAQTLQAAGFDVVGARDLDEDSLRHAFRDFVDNASKAGPGTVVAIYFAGYGLQLEGENYLLPVDANIGRDTDVPLHGLRLSDYTHALAGAGLKAAIVVLDAARANPFTVSGQPLASGLALVDPEPGQLIAFNATPGTVAPEVQDGYGPFAKALAEMIREGGLQPADVFDRVRLRVNEITQGAQVPWEASKINTQFVFFERGPDAPPPVATAAQTAALRNEPIRDLGAQDAYQAALARDTLDSYEDFLTVYPRDPMAKRVRAIVSARREAVTWRRTYDVDTPDAYWSYLRRYPRGPHVADCRRRLAQLAAAFDPPPRFVMIDYDVPPPPPEEVVYYERPVLVFNDPFFAFAPPPPPPVYFLAPPPPEFVVLAPPPPPIGVFILPVPVFVPVPVYVSAPAYVAPPPNPVYFNNIHNTVVINNTTNVVTITNPAGKVVSNTPIAAPAAAGPAAAGPGGAGGKGPVTLTPALPAAVATKAAVINSQNPPGAASPAKTGPGTLPPGQTGVATAPGNKPLPLPNTPAAPNGPNPAGGKPTPTATSPITTPAAKLAPLDTGKQPGSNAPTGNASTTPAAGATTPAAKLTPLDTGKQPGSNAPAGNAGKTTAPTTPAAKLAPLDAGKPPGSNAPAGKPATAPATPTAKLAPDTDKKEKAAPIHTPAPPKPPVQPAPAVVHQAAPPPPPPPVVHQAPAVVHQAPPQQPVVHQAPPPSPPPVRQVQTPPPPPPQAAAPRGGGGGGGNSKCPIVNGKPTCK